MPNIQSRHHLSQRDLIDLLDEIGVFYQVDRTAQAEARSKFGASAVYEAMRYPGANFSIGRDLTDQLGGLRKALSNRARPPQLRVTWRNRRAPK